MAAPHRSSVTQRDIARHCGVHQTTVSMVLRNDPRVSAETAAAVRAAIAELGYDAGTHEVARRMVLRRYGRRVINQTMALWFPAGVFQVPYFNRLLHGITDGVEAQEFALLTSFFRAFGSEVDVPLPPCFRREQVDGILALQPPVLMRKLLGELRQWDGFGDRPVVSLVFPLEGCAAVMPDYAQGAYFTAQHLLSLGHRHLLHLIPPFTEIYETQYLWDCRYAGLTRALAEAGLDPAEHLHTLDLPSNWIDPQSVTEQFSRRAMGGTIDPAPALPLLTYLGMHPEVTAVLGWNDACAINCWLALTDAGLRIPDDLSLVGFDDTDPLPDASGRNILTTVRQPLEALGQAAVALLIDLIHERVPADTHRLVPTALQVRGTTGPAPR